MSVIANNLLARLKRGITRTVAAEVHRKAVAADAAGFFGEEVVAEIYRLLAKNEVARIFNPSQNKYRKDGFYALIGDDTWPGDCSDRTAYMRYEHFSIAPLADGSYYAIGLGRNAQPGYYVADEYQNDIMIVFLPPNTDIKNEEETRKTLRSVVTDIFLDSPVVGLRDGGLHFGGPLHYRFEGFHPGYWLEKINVDKFVFNPPKGNDGGNGSWKKMWNKDLPSFLATKISAYLPQY